MGFVVCGGLLRYGVRRLRFSLLMGFVVSISLSHYDVCRLLDLSLYCTFVRCFPNKEGNRRLKIFCFAVLVNQIFFFRAKGRLQRQAAMPTIYLWRPRRNCVYRCAAAWWFLIYAVFSPARRRQILPSPTYHLLTNTKCCEKLIHSLYKVHPFLLHLDTWIKQFF